MVIQCKNLISLYILPDQRRVNLLVSPKAKLALTAFLLDRLMLASILLCLHSDGFIRFSFSFLTLPLYPYTRHIHLCALFCSADACYTPS